MLRDNLVTWKCNRFPNQLRRTSTIQACEGSTSGHRVAESPSNAPSLNPRRWVRVRQNRPLTDAIYPKPVFWLFDLFLF